MIKGGARIFLVYALLVLTFSGFVLAENTNTTLEVGNSPPVLKQNIDIVSFEGNYSNAFDLDDYFLDYEQSLLTYSYGELGTEGFDVSIDANNVVSFTSWIGLDATGYFYFYASDGSYSTSSNKVYYYLGEDVLNPSVSNVGLSSYQNDDIKENDIVTFSADLSDDRNLSRFDFRLAYGLNSSWDVTSLDISGKSYSANVETQIRRSPGTMVYWKFCAYDNYDNENCSVLNSFNISGQDLDSYYERKNPIEEDSLSSVTVFSKNEIVVDNEYFFRELKQGMSDTGVLKITNRLENSSNFTLSVFGLKDIIFLGDKTFYLEKDQSKQISFDFVVPKDLLPGEYSGSLIIDGIETREIPIIIFVNPLYTRYSLGVDIQSEKVSGGRNITSKISIKNNGDEVVENVSFEYAIKDLTGKTYLSSEEILEVSNQLDFERSIVIPKNFTHGNYLFYAKLSTKKDYVLAADAFRVGPRYEFLLYVKKFFYLIIAGLVFFVFMFFAIRYILKLKKERAMKLYMQLQLLKKHMKEGKYDKAADLYISIKKGYKQKIPGDLAENKEMLKKKIEELCQNISLDDESSEGDGSSDKSGGDKKEGASKDVEKKESESDKKTEEGKKEEVVAEKSSDGEDKKEDDKSADSGEEKKEDGAKSEGKNSESSEKKEEVVSEEKKEEEEKKENEEKNESEKSTEDNNKKEEQDKESESGEKKEDSGKQKVDLKEVEKKLGQCFISLKKGEHDSANDCYNEVKNLYKTLSKEDKEIIYSKLEELRSGVAEDGAKEGDKESENIEGALNKEEKSVRKAEKKSIKKKSHKKKASKKKSQSKKKSKKK